MEVVMAFVVQEFKVTVDILDPIPAFTGICRDDNLRAARNYLDQLDLGYIIDSMCSPHYFLPRWTLTDANHCCQLYKNFLWLNKKYLPLSLVPTREIDEFWHNHILHTRKYIDDCEKIFGHYLHHHPASPNDDPQQLVTDFKKTKQLYLKEFKQPLVLDRIV